MSSSRILHTMIRVKNLDKAIQFYTEVLGMKLRKKTDYESGKFTLAFLHFENAPNGAEIELTYNWDNRDYEIGTGYGHIAIAVSDIVKTCETIKQKGGEVTREPGPMKFGGNSKIAFIKDVDGYSIELIEK